VLSKETIVFPREMLVLPREMVLYSRKLFLHLGEGMFVLFGEMVVFPKRCFCF